MTRIVERTYREVDPATLARYDFWRWMVPILIGFLLIALTLFNRTLGTAPTADLPAEGVVGDTTISGTGEPGSTVQIVEQGDGGSVLGSAVVGEDGTWAVELPSLGAGEYQVDALDVDDAGVVKRSGFDAALGRGGLIVYDEPTLNGLDRDLVPGRMALSGTGTPGSQLIVLQNGEEIGRVTVDSEGEWLFDMAELDPGDYEFTVRLDDSNGNELITLPGISDSIGEFPIVEFEPLNPTLDGLEVDAADPGAGKLSLSGTGEPGGQIEVVVNGDPTIVEIGSDGNWSLELDGLDPGADVDVVVNGLDANGNLIDGLMAEGSISLPSLPEVVVEEPELIELDLPTVELPDLDSDAFDPLSGRLRLLGTGTPGSEVEIVLNGESVGREVVDPDGNWSYDLDGLRPGEFYDLIIRALNPDGSVNVESEPIAIAYPEVPVVEAGNGSDEGTGSDDDGSGSDDDMSASDDDASAEGDDSESASSDEEVATEESDADSSATEGSDVDSDTVAATGDDGDLPRIIGTNVDALGRPLSGFYGLGNPNTILDIVDRDGEIVGVASVRSNGDWRCSCNLPPGSYDLKVRERENQNAQSDYITISVPNPAPALNLPGATPDPNNVYDCSEGPVAGVIDLGAKIYTVGRCENIFVIAERLGTTPDDLLLFNPQVADASRIFTGQLLNIPSNAGCFDSP